MHRLCVRLTNKLFIVRTGTTEQAYRMYPHTYINAQSDTLPNLCGIVEMWRRDWTRERERGKGRAKKSDRDRSKKSPYTHTHTWVFQEKSLVFITILNIRMLIDFRRDGVVFVCIWLVVVYFVIIPGPILSVSTRGPSHPFIHTMLGAE